MDEGSLIEMMKEMLSTFALVLFICGLAIFIGFACERRSFHDSPVYIFSVKERSIATSIGIFKRDSPTSPAPKAGRWCMLQTTKPSFSFFERIEDFQCFEKFPKYSKTSKKENSSNDYPSTFLFPGIFF